MRIKKKFVLGNILAICSFIIVVWLFKESDNLLVEERSYAQNGGIGLLGKFFPTRLLTTVNQCFSNLKRYSITADFTLNNVLDHMKLSLYQQGLRATLDDATFKRNDRLDKGPLPSNHPLEVIVIPHSHNDPGWKKTYMKYFLDQTTHILSLMVEKLTQYPDMTFIWVESCFLHTWWANQTVAVRDKFRELVQSGRIEIVSGMWVAPDEASPHYFALVDQMVEGHYWIKKHLNVVPESSLNFDQFGYSASMPYLVKKAGLKHVLIKRIHRGVKQIFGEKNWMNFYWRQFWDQSGKDDIFTLVDTYEWMSISDSCGPDRAVCRGLDFAYMKDLPDPKSASAKAPMVADWASHKMVDNFETFVSDLVNQFRLKAANYKQNVMMLPHGGDFRYDKADEWDRQYRNLKLFMQYVNANKDKYNVHIRFGTLKDYFEASKKQEEKYKIEYPVVSGDFFTYTESQEYWTGYFTTRQFDKRLSREALESVRAAELFTYVAFQDAGKVGLSNTTMYSMLQRLAQARQDLGIFQHHDAITGTAQAHVAADYEQRLTSALIETQHVLSEALAYILNNREDGSARNKFMSALNHDVYNKLTRRVVFPVSSKDTKIVLLNSLTQKRSELVTITVNSNQIELLNHLNKPVTFDVVSQDEAAGSYEIMFKVDFQPVSIITYTVRTQNEIKQGVLKSEEPGICENDFMNVTFSKITGSPTKVCYKKEQFCSSVQIDWRYYKGNGGAYTMRSFGVEESAEQNGAKIVFTNGKTFCRVKASFKYIQATYTLPRTNGGSGRALRVDVRTDLTEIASAFHGDLAMRVITNISNDQIFYVDSNSFQMMGRKFRTNIPFDETVYPMSSMAFIEDASRRFVVHSAQPHGVVSRTSGMLDLMLDRTGPIPEMDMPEPVRDSKPTKMIFFLEIESITNIQKVTTQETAIPTSNSAYINDILQHPIYKFYNSESHIADQYVTLLKQELSCDVIIANIKNLIDDKNKFDGTSITLFRRSVACSTSQRSEYMCDVHSTVQVAPSDLIGRSNRKSSARANEVTLSHLYNIGTLFQDEPVTLDPMDIKTFHIKYNAQ